MHVVSSTWTVDAWLATRVAVDRSKLLKLRSTPRASPAPTTARAAEGGANARRAGKACWLEMSDAAGRPTVARGATPEISDAAGRAMGARVATPETSDLETRPGAATLNLSKP